MGPDGHCGAGVSLCERPAMTPQGRAGEDCAYRRHDHGARAAATPAIGGRRGHCTPAHIHPGTVPTESGLSPEIANKIGPVTRFGVRVVAHGELPVSILRSVSWLGCTRFGSPGISGCPHPSKPCSPAPIQVAQLCHAGSYRASIRPNSACRWHGVGHRSSVSVQCAWQRLVLSGLA